MIKTDYISEGYEIREWRDAGADDHMRFDAYDMLMGETEKGDTLEFKSIVGNGMELFAGILRNRDGKMKIIIPLILIKSDETKYTEYYYTGEIVEIDKDIEAERREISKDADIHREVLENFLQ